MKSFFLLFFCVAASAKVPAEALTSEMSRTVTPLQNADGWKKFIKEHPSDFPSVGVHNPGPNVLVDPISYKIDGATYRVGMAVASVFIKAKPETVVSVVDEPRFFKALYGLDRDSNLRPKAVDGSYDARIFKFIPGVETQDYTLHYSGHWEDKVWIQRANLVKDEHGFALRDNIKIVEPLEDGSVYREVSLFFPMRWWLRLLSGPLKSITIKEVSKVGKAVKCMAEKAQGGQSITEDLAAKCNKEASR